MTPVMLFASPRCLHFKKEQTRKTHELQGAASMPRRRNKIKYWLDLAVGHGSPTLQFSDIAAFAV